MNTITSLLIFDIFVCLKHHSSNQRMNGCNFLSLRTSGSFVKEVTCTKKAVYIIKFLTKNAKEKSSYTVRKH